MAALISSSVVPNQAPAEAARPWRWEQFVAWCACLLPAYAEVPNCNIWWQRQMCVALDSAAAELQFASPAPEPWCLGTENIEPSCHRDTRVHVDRRTCCCQWRILKFWNGEAEDNVSASSSFIANYMPFIRKRRLIAKKSEPVRGRPLLPLNPPLDAVVTATDLH